MNILVVDDLEKMGTRNREIPIQENLREWIELFQREPESYPMFPKGKKARFRVVKKNVLREDQSNEHDIMRHTFISYFVGKSRSVGEAALQAGNSERIIKKHYLNLVHEEDAERFWEIVPSAREKVVSFATVANSRGNR